MIDLQKYDADIYSLKQFVHRLPGATGWWKSNAEESIAHTAVKLYLKGFTAEEAKELITDFYVAIKEEYGE